MTPSPRRSKVPAWVVGLAVVATAAITLWAMLYKKGWPIDTAAVALKARVYSPITAVTQPNGFLPIAGTPQPGFGLAQRPATTCVCPPQTQTPAPAATKPAEWLGLEVAAITPARARRFRVPAGIRGLVITEAEAQAAKAGLRAGDVIVSVGDTFVTDAATFNRATQHGKRKGGAVGILRSGRFMKLALGSPTSVPPNPLGPAALRRNNPSARRPPVDLRPQAL